MDTLTTHTMDILTTHTVDTMDATIRSNLMKLFGPDPEGKLQEARDKIYAHVWSRRRRDEAKFDWVLSQNGIDRNVPERFIEGVYGPTAFQSIYQLPCWLLFADQQIARDFTRYIHTTNELEVDVELKAIHTAQNETKLLRILTLLQNPNFARYTRSVRVRIHFPGMYPFQELPAFNQHVLEGIATILDGFQQLNRLDIRVVTMQGPRDYELRLAAFPFYPVSFTHWSLHIFNSATSQWDTVGQEQQHRLNIAWTVFQATGSLTLPVKTGVAKNKSVSNDQDSNKEIASLPKTPVMIQDDDGSQKRETHTIRTVSGPHAGTGSVPAASTTAPSRPTPAVHPHLESDGPSPLTGAEPAVDASPPQSGSSESEPSRAPFEEHPAPEIAVATAVGPRQPPSPPLSPSKLPEVDATVYMPAPDARGEVIMTQSDSSVASAENYNGVTTSQLVTEVEDTANEPTGSKMSQASQPPSPALSSAMLGPDQEEDEDIPAAAKVSDREGPFADEQDGKRPLQKKKKNRKKSKKSKKATTLVEDTEHPLLTGGVVEHGENEDELALDPDKDVSSDENQTYSKDLEYLLGLCQELSSPVHYYLTDKPAVPLSELSDLRPLSAHFCIGRQSDGARAVVRRTREAEWHLRQQARVHASQLEKEAERMKAKEKRQSKKVKKTLIRRKDPSQNLRRQVENPKQQNIGKSSGGLTKTTTTVDSLNDIDNAEAEFMIHCIRSGIQLEFSVPNTGNNHIECSGSLGNDVGGDGARYQHTPLYDHPPPQSHYENLLPSQPTASTQPPAHGNKDYQGWASNMFMGDDASRSEAPNTQAPMEQEMEAFHVGYADTGTLVNDNNWRSAHADDQCKQVTYENADLAYGGSAQLSNVASMDQGYHHEDCQVEVQHLLEELDDSYEPDDPYEPDGADVSVAQCADDEAPSVPQDDDTANGDEHDGNEDLLAE